MKDAFGNEIKEGDVVMYSAGDGDDHGVKVGVVTGLREDDRSWNHRPIVKSYDKPNPYNQFTQGKMGRTGMPKATRCIVVPLSAVPQEAQDAFRLEFPEYFQSTASVEDELRGMSQWLWVTDADLQRNLIARRADNEIAQLKSRICQLEQATRLPANSEHEEPSAHIGE